MQLHHSAIQNTVVLNMCYAMCSLAGALNCNVKYGLHHGRISSVLTHHAVQHFYNHFLTLTVHHRRSLPAAGAMEALAGLPGGAASLLVAIAPDSPIRELWR